MFEMLYQWVPIKRRAPLHLVDTPDNATLHFFIHCYVHIVHVQYAAASDSHAFSKEHSHLTFNQTLAIQGRMEYELWTLPSGIHDNSRRTWTSTSRRGLGIHQGADHRSQLMPVAVSREDKKSESKRSTDKISPSNRSRILAGTEINSTRWKKSRKYGIWNFIPNFGHQLFPPSAHNNIIQVVYSYACKTKFLNFRYCVLNV